MLAQPSLTFSAQKDNAPVFQNIASPHPLWSSSFESNDFNSGSIGLNVHHMHLQNIPAESCFQNKEDAIKLNMDQISDVESRPLSFFNNSIDWPINLSSKLLINQEDPFEEHHCSDYNLYSSFFWKEESDH